MSRILVTGVSGYLGRRVLDTARARGLETYGTSRSAGVGVPACDLTTPDSLMKTVVDFEIDTIVHCAARAPKSAAEYDDPYIADNNLAMIDALVAANPRRLVFASSMTVYGEATPMPAREDAADGGETRYAQAKLAAEQRLAAAHRDVVCLRLPGLFGGSRRSGLLYNAARAFCGGLTPTVTQNPPLWAALHVDDAAELFVRALTYDGPMPHVLNAGYVDAMSIASAVSAIAARFHRATPALPSCPTFTMDLQRLKATLGLPATTFGDRLDELCQTMRAAA